MMFIPFVSINDKVIDTIVNDLKLEAKKKRECEVDRAVKAVYSDTWKDNDIRVMTQRLLRFGTGFDFANEMDDRVRKAWREQHAR